MKTLDFPVSNQIFSSYCFNVRDDIQSILIDSFTQWINKLLKDNRGIADGVELLYGWTSIQCRVLDSRLSLKAPDQKNYPLRWTEDLTDALESIVYHQFVPESFELECDTPSLHDTVLVTSDFDKIPMFLTRSEKNNENDQHSGWFLASSSEAADISDENSLKIMSIYEAVLAAPHIYKYISMPVGSQIIFETKTPTFSLNNIPIVATENSLVAKDLEPA